MASDFAVSVETRTDSARRHDGDSARRKHREPAEVEYSPKLVKKIKALKKAHPAKAPEKKDEFLRWLNEE